MSPDHETGVPVLDGLVCSGDFIDQAPTSWDDEHRKLWADWQAAQRNKMVYRAVWLESMRQRDEAVAALKPFADEAAQYEPDEDDGDQIAWNTKLPICVFRRAAEITGRAR